MRGLRAQRKYLCIDDIADDEVYSTIYSEYADSSSNSADNENYSVERTDFVETADAKYNYFVLPFPEDKALTALVNDEYIVADDDSFFKLASPVSEQLAFVNQIIDSLEKVFLWVGIVMALFSMLLLFNFISVSISNKKKEIGLLRAVEARSADVFKIFYAESAIITIICYVLAMIACLVICPILNTQIAATLSVIRIRTRIVADNACDSARNVNYRNFPARILNSPQKARGKYPRTVKSFDIRLKIKKGATGSLFYSRFKILFKNNKTTIILFVFPAPV